MTLILQHYNSNTHRTYSSYWRRFEVWAQEQHVPPLPADPGLVCSYLLHLRTAGCLPATYRVALAAITFVHTQHRHDTPCSDPDVRTTLAALTRAHPSTARQSKPLTAVDLAAIKATAHLPRSGTRGLRRETTAEAAHRAAVDIALIMVMRDGLLRRAEAANATWGHVELVHDGTGRLHIPRSKTDQEGRGAWVFLSRETCTALQAILPDSALLSPTHRLFCGRRGPLGREHIGRRIAAAARAAGLGDGFSGHSCRVGMAVDLAAAGCELPELMQAGRWTSAAMVARYTANIAVTRGAVAKYYGYA